MANTGIFPDTEKSISVEADGGYGKKGAGGFFSRNAVRAWPFLVADDLFKTLAKLKGSPVESARVQQALLTLSIVFIQFHGSSVCCGKEQ